MGVGGGGDDSRRASKSALGGADDEKGSAYRAGVGAVIAAHALRGWHLPGLGLPRETSVPENLKVETDDPVDDLGATLHGGGRLFVQAKSSLTLRTRPGDPLAKALAQCRSAAEKSDLNAERDRLVIATGAPSKSIKDLASALERRRDPFAGAPTKAEAEALAKLEPLLAGLGEGSRDLLLDCLVIWLCAAERDSDTEARIGALMLDSAVVVEGEGERAFRELRALSRLLAAKRGGRDRAGLLTELQDAGVTVRPSGHLLARLAAVAAYRQRLQRLGESIALVGVGAGLPPIAVPDVDAEVKVSEPSQDEPAGSFELTVLLRRRGRLLLGGLPGSGKSTALRRAAASQAAEPQAPLPIFVDLKRLVARVGQEGTLDALVDSVCVDAPMAGRSVLAEALHEAIERGEATLYLDSLDETRGAKKRVVAAIGHLIADAGDSLEAAIATRDSAIEVAHALDFHDARLQPPRKIETTVKAILGAYARRDTHDKAWVTRRTAWVERILSRDPDLKATPLIPILLAMSAATRSDSRELPKKRAEILIGVVRDVVAQWEAGRQNSAEPGLGPLTGERAAEALFGCFVCEGRHLSSATTISDVDAAGKLERYLIASWELNGPEARAAAQEAVSFWDEAGFFLRAPDGGLETRVRLFAEIADAAGNVDDGGRVLERWVREGATDAERIESVKLAAGLSVEASGMLCRSAIASREVTQLRAMAEALEEGATLEEERLAELCVCLRDLVETREPDSIEAAGLLGDLDVPEGLRSSTLEAFASNLSAEQALIAQVRGRARWGMAKDPTSRQLFFEILKSHDPKAKSTVETQDSGTFEFWGVDRRWGDAIVLATRALAADCEEAAALAAPLMREVSGTDSTRIAAALEEAGHTDLVTRELKEMAGSMRSAKNWQKELRRSHEAELSMLDMVVGLAEPRELSLRERRGLDELVDFIYTLGIPESRVGESDAFTLEAPVGMELFINCVAALAELDLPALAAEAATAKLEIGDEELSETSSLMMIPGSERSLTRWQVVADQALLRDQLVRLLKGARFAASVAAHALVRAPKDLAVAAEVNAALPGMNGWQRRLAGIVILDTLPIGADQVAAGDWLTGTDSFLGRAAALWAAARFENRATGAREALEAALADADSYIRNEALYGLKGRTFDQALRSSIGRAADCPSNWECDHCGHRNPGEVSACPECRFVGPKLRSRVDELLA